MGLLFRLCDCDVVCLQFCEGNTVWWCFLWVAVCVCVCLIKGKENAEWFDYTENDFSRLRTADVCLKVTKLLRYNKGLMGS